MSGARIDPALHEAYLSTRYLAWHPGGELVLEIGVRSHALKELMEAHGTSSGCFVTAHNPFSATSDDASNEAANTRLRHVLTTAGWTVFDGEGRGTSGDWPAEPSFLVLGCGKHDAIGLCERFQQNAVVCFDADAVPRLILHPAVDLP
jgi:hypothetical protein